MTGRRALRGLSAALLLGCLLLAPGARAVRTVNSGNLCIWWAQRGHPFVIDPARIPVPGTSALDAIRR
ncbi:hypothetical protein ABTL91_19175, partial [Acinetobacter baumannii]